MEGASSRKHHSPAHPLITWRSQQRSRCGKGYGSGTPRPHAAKGESGPDLPDPSASTFHPSHCAPRGGQCSKPGSCWQARHRASRPPAPWWGRGLGTTPRLRSACDSQLPGRGQAFIFLSLSFSTRRHRKRNSHLDISRVQ